MNAAWHVPVFADMDRKRTAETPLSKDRREAVENYIHEHTTGAAEALEAHWFVGDAPDWPHDAGKNFCFPCAEAIIGLFYEEHPELDELDDDGEVDVEAREVYIDGVGRTEHDSTPFCEECGALLNGCLTDYGVEQELEHFADPENYPGPGWPDTWALIENAIIDLPDDDSRWYNLEKLVEHARGEEQAATVREAEQAALPGMREARVSLLDVLGRRSSAIHSTPSFRLWNELTEFLALDRDGREAARGQALERRLTREAEEFLRHCADVRYFGGRYAAAPYGEFWWPFVVEAEQFRLWKHPTFLLGQAAETARRACRRPPQRLDPPYPHGTVEYRAWTAGEMVAGSHA